MYEKARDTAVGAAAAAGAGAQNLKDRVMGSSTSTQPVRPPSAVCQRPGPLLAPSVYRSFEAAGVLMAEVEPGFLVTIN